MRYFRFSCALLLALLVPSIALACACATMTNSSTTNKVWVTFYYDVIGIRHSWASGWAMPNGGSYSADFKRCKNCDGHPIYAQAEVVRPGSDSSVACKTMAREHGRYNRFTWTLVYVGNHCHLK